MCSGTPTPHGGRWRWLHPRWATPLRSWPGPGCCTNNSRSYKTMRKPNYDKFPYVSVAGRENACAQGWEAIAVRLEQDITGRSQAKVVLVVECYVGVDETRILH